MKLHTTFITHNRLHLTKQAIETYLATVTVPYTYVVVDNNSDDGTQDWLAEEGHPSLLLWKNYYPGFACNRGWEQRPQNSTHLHRADNDMSFIEGWVEHVQAAFRNSRVGQVGLRTDAEEFNAPMNVGGNSIIIRRLWDKGLRYDETPWPKYAPGMSEDSYFSPAVKKLGYRWGRVAEPCLNSLASGDWNDIYYQRSYGDRKITRGSLWSDKERRGKRR